MKINNKEELIKIIRKEIEKQGKVKLDLNHLDVSEVEDFSDLFYILDIGAYLEELHVSSWNTSSATRMYNMFGGCNLLRRLDLSTWNVSKVTNMSEMFYECWHLKSAGISGWNVSRVKDMSNMFEGCTLLNEDISGWDVSEVRDVDCMFSGCESFNTDLSAWDTSNVTRMASMFFSCQEFNSDLSGWDVSKVKNVSNMFYGCTKFNSDISGWDVSSVNEALCMLSGCDSFTYSIKNWKLGKLGETEIEDLVFGRDRGTCEIAEREEPIEEVIRGRRSIGPYYVIDRVKKIKVTSKEELREQIKIAIDKQGPNVDLEHLDVSEITDMSELFAGLTVCWVGVFSWDVSKVTTMKAMFKGCNCLYLCPNSLMYWNVSKVTDMSEMFSGCGNVKIPVHKYWRIDENMVNVDKMFENSGVQ